MTRCYIMLGILVGLTLIALGVMLWLMTDAYMFPFTSLPT